MDYELVQKLEKHENRIGNLEKYQKKQNGTMRKIEEKLDKLIWAIGAGMFTILVLLVRILANGA